MVIMEHSLRLVIKLSFTSEFTERDSLSEPAERHSPSIQMTATRVSTVLKRA